MIRGRLIGSDDLIRRIGSIKIHYGNFLGGMPTRVGEFLVKRIKRRYLERLDPELKPWKELAPSTKKIKESLFVRGLLSADPPATPGTILVRTGNLYRSIGIIEKTSSLAGQTGLGFRIGVKDKDAARYGRFHQYGRKKLPKRAFLGFSRLDIKAVDSLLRRDFAKVFTK